MRLRGHQRKRLALLFAAQQEEAFIFHDVDSKYLIHHSWFFDDFNLRISYEIT